MRVLVCGDRDWDDPAPILERLKRFPEDTVVIHGAARGADTLGGEAAEQLGLKVESYPAQWKKYGRAAGPIRNKQMLVEGLPTWVLAFHADIEHSKGTADMVRRARKVGLIVEVITGPV